MFHTVLYSTNFLKMELVEMMTRGAAGEALNARRENTRSKESERATKALANTAGTFLGEREGHTNV